MTRAVYDVVPADGHWVIRMAGNGMWETLPTKGEAVRRARELGRRHDTWLVRVHTASGAIEEELASAGAASGSS